MNDLAKDRKIGLVKISDIDMFPTEVLSKLFSVFFPVTIDKHSHPYNVNYFGYSEFFEPVNVGCEIPIYIATITTLDDLISVKFDKEI